MMNMDMDMDVAWCLTCSKRTVRCLDFSSSTLSFCAAALTFPSVTHAVHTALMIVERRTITPRHHHLQSHSLRPSLQACTPRQPSHHDKAAFLLINHPPSGRHYNAPCSLLLVSFLQRRNSLSKALEGIDEHFHSLHNLQPTLFHSLVVRDKARCLHQTPSEQS